MTIKTKLKPILRIQAAVTLLCFAMTQNSYGFNYSLEPLKLPKDFSVNASWGIVKRIYRASSDQFVIHIQDAHVNEDAQKNIAKMVNYFVGTQGVRLVNLEGSSGELAHGVLSRYPHQKARELVAEMYLKRGILSGPEYLAITRRPELILNGVEDAALYQENRDAFLKTLHSEKNHLAILHELERQADSLIRFVFDEESSRWIKQKRDYQKGTLDIMSYAAALRELCFRQGISKKFPQIEALLEKKADSISIKIFDEIASAEELLGLKLFQTADAKTLMDLFQILGIYQKIFDFSLEPEDAQFFYEHRSEFEPSELRKILGGLLRRYGSEISPESLDLETLSRKLPDHEKFYRRALLRDKALAENALRGMRQNKTRVSILITGGFHTPGLEKFFKNRNISYCVITPRLRNMDAVKEKRNYAEAMQNQSRRFLSAWSELRSMPHSVLVKDPRYQLQPPRRIPTLNQLAVAENENGMEFALEAMTVLSTQGIRLSGRFHPEYTEQIKAGLSEGEAKLAGRIYPLFHSEDAVLNGGRKSGFLASGLSPEQLGFFVQWKPQSKGSLNEIHVRDHELSFGTPDGVMTKIRLLNGVLEHQAAKRIFSRARSESREQTEAKPRLLWKIPDSEMVRPGDQKFLSQANKKFGIEKQFAQAGIQEEVHLRAYWQLRDGTRVAQLPSGIPWVKRVYKIWGETKGGRKNYVVEINAKGEIKFQAEADETNQLDEALRHAQDANGNRLGIRQLFKQYGQAANASELGISKFGTVYFKKSSTLPGYYELRIQNQTKPALIVRILDAAAPSKNVLKTSSLGKAYFLEIYSPAPAPAPEKGMPAAFYESPEELDEKAQLRQTYLKELARIASQPRALTDNDVKQAEGIMRKMKKAMPKAALLAMARSEARQTPVESVLSRFIEEQQTTIKEGMEDFELGQFMTEMIQFRIGIARKFDPLKRKAQSRKAAIGKSQSFEDVETLNNGGIREFNQFALDEEKALNEAIEKLTERTKGLNGRFTNELEETLASITTDSQAALQEAGLLIKDLGDSVNHTLQNILEKQRTVTLEREKAPTEEELEEPESNELSIEENLKYTVRNGGLPRLFDRFDSNQKRKFARQIIAVVQQRIAFLSMEFNSWSEDHERPPPSSVWQEEMDQLLAILQELSQIGKPKFTAPVVRPASAPKVPMPWRIDTSNLVVTSLILSTLISFSGLSLGAMFLALLFFRAGIFTAKGFNEVGHTLVGMLKEPKVLAFKNLMGNKSFFQWFFEFFFFVKTGHSPRVVIPELREHLKELEESLAVNAKDVGLQIVLKDKKRDLEKWDSRIRRWGWLAGTVPIQAVGAFSMYAAAVYGISFFFSAPLLSAFLLGGILGVLAAFYSDFLAREKALGTYCCGNLYLGGKDSPEELINIAEKAVAGLFLRGAQEVGIQITVIENGSIKVIRAKEFLTKRSNAIQDTFQTLRRKIRGKEFPGVIKIKIHSRWATTGNDGSDTIEMMAQTAHPFAGEPGRVERVLIIRNGSYQIEERYVENTFAFNGDLDGLDFSRGGFEGTWLENVNLDTGQIKDWLAADLNMNPAKIPSGDAPVAAMLYAWGFSQGRVYPALRKGYRFGVTKSFSESLPHQELKRLEDILWTHIEEKIQKGRWNPEGIRNLAELNGEDFPTFEKELFEILSRDSYFQKMNRKILRRFAHETTKAFFQNDILSTVFWIKKHFVGSIAGQFDSTLRPHEKTLLTWGQPLSLAFGDGRYSGASERKVLQVEGKPFSHRIDMSDSQMEVAVHGHDGEKPYLKLFTGPDNRVVEAAELLDSRNPRIKDMSHRVIDEVPAWDEEYRKNPLEAEIKRIAKVLGDIHKTWKSGELQPTLDGIARLIIQQPKGEGNDILIVGTEKSLFAGTEHAQNLKKIFEGLGKRVIAVSSQDLIELADRHRNEPEGFKRALDINDRTLAMVIAASGGQTQDTKIATDWLVRILPEVFSYTGGKDNLITDVLGTGRNINTLSGANRDELNMVAYAAQNFTFALVELSLTRAVLKLLPEEEAKKLPSKAELDIYERKLDEMANHSFKNLLGYDQDGNFVVAKDVENAKVLGSQQADKVLERQKGWFVSSLYVAVTVSASVALFSGALMLAGWAGIALPAWVVSLTRIPEFLFYIFLSAPLIPYAIRFFQGKFNLARVSRDFVFADSKEYVWRYMGILVRKMASNSYGLNSFSLEGVGIKDAPDERAFSANRGLVFIVRRPDGRVPLSWWQEDRAIRVAKFVKTIMPPPGWIKPFQINLVKWLGIKPPSPEVITFGANPHVDKKSANVHYAVDSVRTLDPSGTFTENTFPVLQHLYESRIDAFKGLLWMMRVAATWGDKASSLKPLHWNPTRTPSTAAYKTTQVGSIVRVLESMADMPVLLNPLRTAQPANKINPRNLPFRVLAENEPLPDYPEKEQETVIPGRVPEFVPLDDELHLIIRETERLLQDFKQQLESGNRRPLIHPSENGAGSSNGAVREFDKMGQAFNWFDESKNRSEVRETQSRVLDEALIETTFLKRQTRLETEIDFDALVKEAQSLGIDLVQELSQLTAHLNSHELGMTSSGLEYGFIVFNYRGAKIHGHALLSHLLSELKSNPHILSVIFYKDPSVSSVDWRQLRQIVNRFPEISDRIQFEDHATSLQSFLLLKAAQKKLKLSNFIQLLDAPAAVRSEWREYYEGMMLGALPLANSEILVFGASQPVPEVQRLRISDLASRLIQIRRLIHRSA